MSSVFFYEPFYDFDRLLDDSFFSQPSPRGGNQQVQRRHESDGAVRAFKPKMDLHEDSEKNLVTASFEFPGVSKEEVQIQVQNGRLTVSAESKQSDQHDEKGYAVRERRLGKYSRTLQLPQGVKEDEITASMEQGILNITFPKSTPDLAPKKISIN